MIATSTISLTGRFAQLLVERYREYLPVYGMRRAAFVTLDDVDAAARKAGYTEAQTGRILLDATRVLDMAQRAMRLIMVEAATFAATTEKIQQSLSRGSK